MRRAITAVVLALGLLGLTQVGPPGAHAAGEYFKVTSVDTAGCGEMQTVLNVEAGGLVGSYDVRTVVTAGGLVFMDQRVEGWVDNGPATWGLFRTFNNGPVPNPGTWPIPAGQPVSVDITLERPAGTVVHSWRTVLGTCTTGAITYNDLAALDADRDLVKIPADACPTVAQPSVANGCPQLTRELKLKYKVRKEQFRGQVLSSAAGLRSGQSVTIYKVRKGEDKRVGGATTEANGKFRLDRKPRVGKYYAVVAAAIDPAAGQAGEAVSTKVKLRP